MAIEQPVRSSIALRLLAGTNAAGGQITRSVSLGSVVHNADEDATAAQVKALMQAVVANKEIFAEPPLTLKSAEMQSTTVTNIDIS